MFINAQQERIFRGDTKVLHHVIFNGDNFNKTLYELIEGDELYFAILEPNQAWENAIVKKKLEVIPETSEFKIALSPTDTMYLMPGPYYYQVKLRRATGEVVTLNPRTYLWIQE